MVNSRKLALVVLVTLLSGCDGGSASKPPANDTIATNAPTTRTPNSTTTKAVVRGPADSLPGFGATRAQWERTHTAASEYAVGKVYGPRLPDGEPRYGSVDGDDYIFSYDLFMPPTTTLAEAQKLVAAEFPANALPSPLHDQGGECYRQTWKHPALRAVVQGMETALGRKGVEVTVVYQPPYPGDNRTAVFFLTDSYDGSFCN